MPDTPGLWGDLREDIDITLPFCLYIPGCMHILGNASQEALTAAVGFDEVLVGLRAICHRQDDTQLVLRHLPHWSRAALENIVRRLQRVLGRLALGIHFGRE